MVWKTSCTYARGRLRDWKVNLRLKVLGMMSSRLRARDELAGEQPEHCDHAAPFLGSSKSCRRHKLTGKHCLAKRVGKTSGELWLVCNSARRQLMTSSVSHKCKRNGFWVVTALFGLAHFFFTTVFPLSAYIWIFESQGMCCWGEEVCPSWCPGVVIGFSGFGVNWRFFVSSVQC